MCISIVTRQGYSADALVKILEPSSSLSVAERMAGNLARSSMRNKQGMEALDHGSYWSTIRRHLAAIAKDEKSI